MGPSKAFDIAFAGIHLNLPSTAWLIICIPQFRKNHNKSTFQVPYGHLVLLAIPIPVDPSNRQPELSMADLAFHPFTTTEFIGNRSKPSLQLSQLATFTTVTILMEPSNCKTLSPTADLAIQSINKIQFGVNHGPETLI